MPRVWGRGVTVPNPVIRWDVEETSIDEHFQILHITDKRVFRNKIWRRRSRRVVITHIPTGLVGATEWGWNWDELEFLAFKKLRESMKRKDIPVKVVMMVSGGGTLSVDNVDLSYRRQLLEKLKKQARKEVEEERRAHQRLKEQERKERKAREKRELEEARKKNKVRPTKTAQKVRAQARRSRLKKKFRKLYSNKHKGMLRVTEILEETRKQRKEDGGETTTGGDS